MRSEGLSYILAPKEVSQDVQRRIFAIGVLLTLAAVVLAAGTVAWNGAIHFGRYLDEGLLGPEGQRQRIALAEHGFTVSIGADLDHGDPAPDPQRDERLGMHALLSIDPGEDGAACTVYVAARAAPHQLDADEEPGDNEVLTATAVRLLGPWLEEQGLNGDALGTTTGDDWGGKAGSASTEGRPRPRPHGSSPIRGTCTCWPVPGRLETRVGNVRSSGESTDDAGPGADGRRHRASAATGPAPTPRVLGQGGHVWATEPGVGLTFPRGWAVVESGAEDHGQALNFVDPRRMVPELHTAVLGALACLRANVGNRSSGAPWTSRCFPSLRSISCSGGRRTQPSRTSWS